MILSKEQFIKYVNILRTMITQADKIYIALHGEVNIFDEWTNYYYSLLSDMCELDENIHGGSVLDWYCFETNFGQIDNILRWNYLDTDKVIETRITTPEDLYNFIIEQQSIQK